MRETTFSPWQILMALRRWDSADNPKQRISTSSSSPKWRITSAME